MTNEPSNKPLETLRDGVLKATIWANQTEKGTFYNTNLSKLYEDRNGQLKETTSYNSTELLRIAELARQAHTNINMHRAATLTQEAHDAPLDADMKSQSGIDDFDEDMPPHDFPEPNF